MKYDIYINADIGWPISYEYVRSELSKFEGQDVNVYVSSLGGSLVHALKIRRLFIDHGRVTCHLHGFVASAATILATGAQRVLMGRHALYLAHLNSLPVDVWGYHNTEDIERAIEELQNNKLDLDKIDSTVAGIYAARGSKTAEEFHAIMAKDLWMNAEEVLALGLADELAEDDSTTFAAASAQGGYSAALRSKIAAYGLPHLPAASHETAAINPHKPTDMPNVNIENKEEKKPTALAAFFAKLADKLDAFFGLDNLETEAAPAAAATAEPAAPAAAAEPEKPAAATEAPAAAAEPEKPAAEPEAPAATAEPEAPAAEPEANAEATAARLRAAEAEIAALRAQIETMQKQDGATSDPIASAPEEGTENPADRFRRLRAACRRYK